ncbi:MAG: tetratricopeptide repeat protein [Chloroflexota bacterium]
MAGNQTQFEEAMNKGHSAAWDQEWEQAARYYRMALEEFPDHPAALSNLGLALYELQDFDEALQVYKRVALLNPQDPIPAEKMARIYERQGRLNEAIRAGMQAAELHLKARDVEKSIEGWQRVLSLNPEIFTGHSRLAMIYERLGKKAEAVSELVACASLMQHAGDLQKAQQIVLYALKLIPGSAEATQALQMLKSGQPMPKPQRPRGGTGPMRMADVKQLAAPQEAGKPPSLDPIAETRQRALIQLAELLFDAPDDISATESPAPRRGINALMRGTGELVLDPSTRTRVLLHIGQAIESQTTGQEKQAAEELERAYDLGFSHPALYFDLGFLLAEKQDQKALPILLKAVKHPEYSLGSYLLLAGIYYRAENYKEAAAAYLQALRMADAETVPLEHREELRQIYEPIIEAQSHIGDVQTLKALCETIAEQLLRSDWRDFLNKARQQLPPQPPQSPPAPLASLLLESRSSEVIEAIGRIRQLAKEGKYRTALEEAHYAIDYAPTYLPLHIEIAELLVSNGQIQEAVTKYLLVADLYNLRGEASQAIQILERLIQLSPADVQLRKRLLRMLTEQGRVDDAVKQYMEIAQYYIQLAELDTARQVYLDALKLSQQSKRSRQLAFQLLGKLAEIDMERLEWRQALRFYEQMRSLQPNDPAIRNRIVVLNFRIGQDKAAYLEVDNFIGVLEGLHQREAAIQFIKGILMELPEMVELHRRLADLYKRDHRHAEAVEELDFLAEHYASAGEPEQSARLVEEIIRLNPPNRADYEAVLQKLLKKRQ